jgi:hypothetical protein
VRGLRVAQTQLAELAPNLLLYPEKQNHIRCVASRQNVYVCDLPCFLLLQVSGEPIPVPKVDSSNKELFNKTVDDIHAKVRRV